MPNYPYNTVGGCCSPYASNGPSLYGGDNGASAGCNDNNPDYSGCEGNDVWDVIWNDELDWDDDLLNLFNIPKSMLPEVKQSSDYYGDTDPDIFSKSIPIGGIAGDQQSALFGQMCVNPGMVKNTYGTGCFLIMNTGSQAIKSKNNLSQKFYSCSFSCNNKHIFYCFRSYNMDNWIFYAIKTHNRKNI